MPTEFGRQPVILMLLIGTKPMSLLYLHLRLLILSILILIVNCNGEGLGDLLQMSELILRSVGELGQY